MTMIKVRLDKVEMLLSPKQAMIAWMTEHHRQYCDEGEYSLSLAMQPERPHPLERLSGQTEAAVRDRTKGKPKQEIDQAILEAKKELGFLYQLFNDVDQFVLKELQLIRLRAALLSEGIRAADERESATNEAQKLVGYLARAPYPLCAADAASVLTVVRKRVLTFTHLESVWEGQLNAPATFPTDLDQRVDRQENPVLEWVRAHFAREGRTTIPQEAYAARERGEYSQRPRTPLTLGPDREQVRSLFPDSKAYAEFVSGRDFSYGLADVRDEEFHRVVDWVVKALRELVASGEVQAAKQIFLPSSPFPFLRHAPVIDNQWVDQNAVELAEFGCLLLQDGFELQERFEISDLGPHPLASCAFWPGDNDEGKDSKVLRDKVVENLSKFPGRAISIEGRPFLNLSDYLAWPDARAAREIKIEEGFSVASLNAWVEKKQATGEAKLAGIDLEPVFFSVSESSFVTCSNDEEAFEKQLERLELLEMLSRRGVDQSALKRLQESLRSYARSVLRVKIVVKYIEDRSSRHRTCSAPCSAYPAGDGNGAILCSMRVNSRRVRRWDEPVPFPIRSEAWAKMVASTIEQGGR